MEHYIRRKERKRQEDKSGESRFFCILGYRGCSEDIRFLIVKNKQKKCKKV